MKVEKVNPAEWASFIDDMYVRTFPGCDMPNLLGDWWIALDGGTVCGFTAMLPYVRVPKTGFLYRSGVIESHRGKGLQTSFIKVREKEARRKGWTALYSDTCPDNDSSQRNLIRAGFMPHRPEFRWSGDEWLYWRKEL